MMSYISELFAKKSVQVGAISAGSGVVGAACGFLFAKKRLEAKYVKIAAAEIADAKQFYGRLHKTDDKLKSPEQVLQDRHGVAADAMREYQGEETVTTEADVAFREIHGMEIVELSLDTEPNAFGEKVTIVQNIFAGVNPQEDDWDYEIETRIREENPGKPYIIHHDEYFEGEKDYEQDTLTYFAGDDVLADDKGVPVPDVEDTVLEDNLTQFGHGSKDKNFVYIRNDRLELDFAVQFSPGKYTVEVLGFDDENELKHSDRRSRPRRGWGDDE